MQMFKIIRLLIGLSMIAFGLGQAYESFLNNGGKVKIRQRKQLRHMQRRGYTVEIQKALDRIEAVEKLKETKVRYEDAEKRLEDLNKSLA